jgi:hypothetical protein
MALALIAVPNSDPYFSLTTDQAALVKPQVERWIRDQINHDWSDMWGIQDQTPELKNELLLGRKDAPDMDREQYVQAMRNTIGIGYPEIKAFKLRAVEIKTEEKVLWISGCAKEEREDWMQTSVIYVRARIVDGKAMFGLPPAGSAETCKL